MFPKTSGRADADLLSERKKDKVMKFIALIAVLASPIAAHADAIDDFVAAEIERQKVPGVALGIFHNGEVLRLQGYGLANIEHGVTVQSNTIFQAGSIGKMFTAAAVMALAEDGLIVLDAPVRNYLPDAPESWDAITPRHLLNHTGGLGSPEQDYRQDYSDDDLVALYAETPALFAPGQRYSYSNTGYALLGIIVNRVAGRHYGEVLQDRVFGPAGMRTARVISDTDIVPNRAAGYEPGEDGLKNQSWVSPSLNATADGSLYLSLLDYARWDAVVARRDIFSTASWRQMLRPAPLNNGTVYPYGFGWTLSEGPDGQQVIGHGGAWQGFQSDLRRYDGDGITFVVLANSAGADVGSILQGVAERFDPRYAKPAVPLVDTHPGLSASFDEALQRIAQGLASPADFQDMDPEWAVRSLERSREAIEAAGDCGEFELTSHQPNGDRTTRLWRADCAKDRLTGRASFDEDGRVVAASVWGQR